MPEFLGIDTSNYTTSAAVYVSSENRIYQAKKLLPVKKGELGLRQSDAVFHHTRQLPEVINQLFGGDRREIPCAVSVSVRPRNVEGSYMPCFLCGESFACSLGAIENIPVYSASHQVGHIIAALYSADRLDLVSQRFIAFHVSGGTTDCLLCEPDRENILNISGIGTSLDLKAGQAIDRVGVMLGLDFPCGRELESLAAGADKRFRVKPVIKGNDCCLSGLENKCRFMADNGEKPENITGYCLDFIAETIIGMTDAAAELYGSLPLVFAGGVMSDKYICDRITGKFKNAYFAAPEFSCDNAAGTAIFGYLKSIGEK